MKNDDTRDRLINAGADALADALIRLAGRHNDAMKSVRRLMATPQANLETYRGVLKDIRRMSDRGDFYDWHDVGELAAELADALLEIRNAAPAPRLGVELIVDFLETGPSAMEMCDDSDGVVSDVFRLDAIDGFVGYARDYDDNDWLVDLTVKLIGDDEYALNERLIDHASEYLPESHLRLLADRFESLAETESDGFVQSTWHLCVESLARQLRDPQLFENTRRKTSESMGIAACLDIGEVYLQSGEPEQALDWFNNAPDDNTFMLDRRYDLLLEANRTLGLNDEASRIARLRFHHKRQGETLSELLELIGEDQRSAVLDEAASQILTEPELDLEDVVFLIEQSRIEDVEAYLLARAAQINGRYYYVLVPIVKSLVELSLHLPATLLYRALLDSILERGYSKGYDHAVSYLRSLDRLAGNISDWREFGTHDAYFEAVKAKHGRKYSFWNRYGESGSDSL
jgi:hypothetical protein